MYEVWLSAFGDKPTAFKTEVRTREIDGETYVKPVWDECWRRPLGELLAPEDVRKYLTDKCTQLISNIEELVCEIVKEEPIQ